MNSLLNVRDIDTMSICSWNSEKTIQMTEPYRGTIMSENVSGSLNHQTGVSLSAKYPIKTLCFSKKSQMMPTKEEYSVLLSCGLGKAI